MNWWGWEWVPGAWAWVGGGTTLLHAERRFSLHLPLATLPALQASRCYRDAPACCRCSPLQCILVFSTQVGKAHVLLTARLSQHLGIQPLSCTQGLSHGCSMHYHTIEKSRGRGHDRCIRQPNVGEGLHEVIELA